jgi:hypothetical protein
VRCCTASATAASSLPVRECMFRPRCSCSCSIAARPATVPACLPRTRCPWGSCTWSLLQSPDNPINSVQTAANIN